MKSAFRNLTAALVTAGVFVTLFGAPSPAEACTPPQSGIFAEGGIRFEQPIPTTGAIAFRVSTWNRSIDDVSIEVTNLDDVSIQGSISHLVVRKPSMDGPGMRGVHLVIWTPTDAFAPTQQYTAVIRAASSYDATDFTIDEIVTFETGSGDLQEPAPASFGEEPSSRISYVLGDEECCNITENCSVEANCGPCEVCWPTRYTYLPTLDIPLVFAQSEIDQQVFHTLEDSTGASRLFWNVSTPEDPISIRFPEDDPGPYCVTLRSFVLATQESIYEEEFCVERSQLPPYQEHEYEYERPQACGEKPDAGGLADVTEDDVTNPADVGNEDAPDATEVRDAQNSDASTDAPGGGCGCSTAPDAPSSLPGLLLLLLALATARLPFFRPSR